MDPRGEEIHAEVKDRGYPFVVPYTVNGYPRMRGCTMRIACQATAARSEMDRRRSTFLAGSIAIHLCQS